MKSKSAEKIKLTSYDDLFGSSEVTAEEKIVSVPIRLFHTFKDHPFRVLDDEKMQETVESVKRYGILMPGIVRPYGDGEYEMVAGHRRWRACELAGMIDMVEEMEAYRKIIRENISYECFEDSRYRQQEEVDELVELMVEVMVMPDNSTVRIGGVDKPVVIVKNRFMKVEHGHIEYVVGCLEKNTSKVGNIRAYLLTTLYNSTMTIENYYRAEVNHDMYGGG